MSDVVILASMRDIEWAVRATRCWSKWDVSEGCQWEEKKQGQLCVSCAVGSGRVQIGRFEFNT